MHLVRTIIAISSGILLAVTLRSPIGIGRAGKIIEAGGRLKFRSSRRTYRRVIEFDAQLCGVTGASNVVVEQRLRRSYRPEEKRNEERRPSLDAIGRKSRWPRASQGEERRKVVATFLCQCSTRKLRFASAFAGLIAKRG